MTDPIDDLLTADQLRTVLAIDQERSFSRAAAVLKLKQPAVTQQVRRLEDKYGRKLFTRGPGGSRFTVDGEALLIYAYAMQKLGRNLAQHLKAEGEPQLARVGLNEDFGRSALPAVLGLFAREHPTVQLKVVCGEADVLFDGLDNDDLDLVITRGHLEPRRGAATWKKPTVWVGRKDLSFPVADPVDLVLPPSGGLRNAILKSLAENGRSWRACFESWEPRFAGGRVAGWIWDHRLPARNGPDRPRPSRRFCGRSPGGLRS